MIRLDEKDIRAVANSRFFRLKEKRLMLYYLGILVVMFGFLFLSDKIWLVFIPFGGFVVLFFWTYKGIEKAKKSLIEEWRKDGVS